MQNIFSILSVPFVVVIFGLAFVFLKETGLLERFFSSEQDTSEPESKFPYRKKDYLLSIAERKFFSTLEQIAEKMNYHLFVKVRLEDLLWIPQGTRDRFGLRNRIKSRHIDFVLCDKQYIKPLLAIELDDSSHQREDRMERDKTVDKIMHDAGLPILHIHASTTYELIELSNKIRNALTPHQDATKSKNY